MAGTASGEPGVGRSIEGISSGHRCSSGEALAEWRSSDQLENGTPSTSPPYWDTDDDDDCGPKPSELYGKHTWKIEKFSQINRREHRGDIFEVGGYKWYILIYPQGCDVCNHLSLFLCVADHEKLLPGWSHFAQFTIAVVNKDPKKSKYSDTLHRFWKKEHDWGWKKFMELSKVLDGFIEADTLIIKAQVQVIREKSRPFRCLDCQYRRELVRVYLTNVEQICRRFVEERRGKLVKLIEDKARWSSFCTFWLGIDQNARRRMSREKTEMILKVVVRDFFIEKEVTSTLVMDSLYSGLKALEGQTKCKKGRVKVLDTEEMPAPMIRVEKDMFVLMEDVLLLLERAALEPLPPKDDKGPQNRTKDGGSGEDFNKDSIERDERRLTELGRRTVEIFVLAHIFSNKIEVAYQEAAALKRQEELIREEEAAWQAEGEQKAKRGAADREKKSKKKQAKQKRNNRKGKDKGKDEKSNVEVHDKNYQEKYTDEIKEFMTEAQPVIEKPDTPEDVSDISDSVDCVAEALQPDYEDRDAVPVNWDTDTSEVNPSTEAGSSGIGGLSSVQSVMAERKSPSVMDDSSSTCSTDSVPSLVMNGPYKGNSFPHYKIQKSLGRQENQQGMGRHEGMNLANEMDSQPTHPASDAGCLNNDSGSPQAAESESEAVIPSLHDQQRKWTEQHVVKKELSVKNQVDTEGHSRNLSSTIPSKSESKSSLADTVRVRASLNSPRQTDKSANLVTSFQNMVVAKPDNQKAATPKPTEKFAAQQVPAMSRPSSAPVIPGPRPTVPAVSMVQTSPLLSRSLSAAGWLGPEPSAETHNIVPQSYRNAMMGNAVAATSSGFSLTHPTSSAASTSPAYLQPPAMASAPMYLAQSSERMDLNSVTSGFSFGMANRDVMQNGPQWMMDYAQRERDVTRSMHHKPSSLVSDAQNIDLYKPINSRSRELFSEFPACTSGRQIHGVLADEFPHLDIINDLLEDEPGIGNATQPNTVFRNLGSEPHMLNRHFSFPGEMSMSGDLGSSGSPCRFERTHSYHDDGFHQDYGSSSSHYDSLRGMIPQVNHPLPYTNGQIDGLISNQWQVASSELPYSMMNTEGNGYSYHIPEYSNQVSDINGYTVFRPSNGH